MREGNKPNVCAPSKYDRKNNTCFSTEDLIEIVKAYNLYISKSKLDPQSIKTFGSADLIAIKPDKKYLLLELKKRFDNVCSDQLCWTRQSFMNYIEKEVKNKINDNTFRPPGPVDSVQWLSTTDINKIMKQYENVYPDFEFIGAVPLDCNDLSFCYLSKIDYDALLNDKIKRVGTIFNLDKHGEPGSHWVSLFIDISDGEVNYCDSNGMKPMKNINSVINYFSKYYLEKTGKKCTIKINSNPYQKDGSECGVYSCNFIIRRLSGENFENVVKNPLTFPQINSCRNVYFQPKNNTVFQSKVESGQLKIHPKCDPK